jgi:hypothetical protein
MRTILDDISDAAEECEALNATLTELHDEAVMYGMVRWMRGKYNQLRLPNEDVARQLLPGLSCTAQYSLIKNALRGVQRRNLLQVSPHSQLALFAVLMFVWDE